MRIQLRRGTTAQWAAANPILASGEPGVDLTTDDLKIGDGAAAWTALGYPNAKESATVYVSPNGSDTYAGDLPGRAKRTLTGALTAVGAGVKGRIIMGSGIIDAGAGVSLSGYACTLEGQGEATVVKATAQTGPVLDFTGYLFPVNAQFRRKVGNFRVQGDGTAGSTKRGIRLPLSDSAPALGMHFHDISIDGTGGAGFDFGGAELCIFEAITVSDPVSARANDIPYFVGTGACNGNTMIGLGCRSLDFSGNADVGASGAFILQPNATWSPYGNHIIGLWCENLHVSSYGSVVHLMGNGNIFDGTVFHDVVAISGAPATCYFRVEDALAGQNYGGNEIRGVIPGSAGVATEVIYGVEMSQDNNRVDGVHGYDGNCVQILPGAFYNSVELSGRYGGTGIGALPPVVDASTNTSNSITLRYSSGDTVLGTSNGLGWGTNDGGVDVRVFRSAAGVLGLAGPVTTSTGAPGGGGATALTATPTGYLTVSINGVDRKIAYY